MPEQFQDIYSETLLQAEESETYTLDELKYDISDCLARKVHIVIDQSYAGEIAEAFKNSPEHKKVIVFASGKDHEYAYNDDYTLHWVQANHKRDCTRQVHEVCSHESSISPSLS